MKKQHAFNLETAMDTWRAFFEQRRSFFNEDLEELEGHLREHIAHLRETGLSEEEAFREATSHLGSVVLLDDAFKDVFWSKIKHKGQLAGTLLFQFAMFRNYLKTALRNMGRHKGYTALNISGLVVGLACAFLIVLWISNERSVDQFHENADRLYQVRINVDGDTGVNTWSNAPLPLADALEQEVADIELAIPTLPIQAVLQKDSRVHRKSGYNVGPGFFRAFTFPLLAGDPDNALASPGSIVISEDVARDYFGADWQVDGLAVGNTLTLKSWQSNGGVLGDAISVDVDREYLVTGVFARVPDNSSLAFDFVLPVQEVLAEFPHVGSWGPRWFEMYVLRAEGADTDALFSGLKPVLANHVEDADHESVILQPYAETYLHGTYANGAPTGGRVQRVLLIGLVGLAILLIACINFTNLLTARSGQRAREIGVRKAMGATPGLLVQQFLGEAVLSALCALVGAVVLTLALLPSFATVTGTPLAVSDLTPTQWLVFTLVAVLTGLVAGAYPAFHLSSIQAIRTLRGQVTRSGRGGFRAREGLVVVQFAISVFLIIGTLTVHEQINYLRSKDLGVDKENVAMIRVDAEFASRADAVHAELERSGVVEQVSLSSANPLSVAIKNSNVAWERKEDGEELIFSILEADEYLAETMNMQMADGRFFDAGRDAGQLHYVVNETAARAMGLQNPVGAGFALGYEVEGGGTGDGVIIGVVKDFHSGSLADQEIGPLVIRYENRAANVMLARIAPGRTAESLDVLGDVFRQFSPGQPFEYTFMDAAWEANYGDENVLATLSRTFAFIAILIACLGLLGLAAFSVQRRTKEIGVRRVLGASKKNVVVILSREFVKPVLVALVVALPVSWWAMNDWLSRYAYRVDVGADTLVLAAVLSLVIALVPVGTQAWRATGKDPVTLLRHD